MKTGDKVKLKSGGVLMTVAEIHHHHPLYGNKVLCQWFDSDNEFHESRFDPDMLMDISEHP